MIIRPSLHWDVLSNDFVICAIIININGSIKDLPHSKEEVS